MSKICPFYSFQDYDKNRLLIDMTLSDKTIQGFKDLLEKRTGKEVSWGEAEEAGERLAGLYKILLEGHLEQESWKKRLEKEPKGFALSGNGRNCAICGDSTKETTNWYDRWGIKCLTCQNAIDKKIISGSIAKTHDNRYSPYELESRFGIKKQTQLAWIKQGILKARIVPAESGRVHYYIFLIKDNKDFLPPKKLTDSQTTRDEKDDKTFFRIEPWYRFVNPYEHLKGYKIMEHIEFIKKENL